jgi:DNA phosphorothioation-dependent restriction protein DptG
MVALALFKRQCPLEWRAWACFDRRLSPLYFEMSTDSAAYRGQQNDDYVELRQETQNFFVCREK